MTKWRSLLPDGSLNRVRLAAVVYAGVGLFSELGQLGNPLRSATYLRVAALSIVLLFVIMVTTYRRGRASGWAVIAVPLLATIGGAGLKDPVATIGLSLAALILLSLYGSTRRYSLQIVGAMVAVPAALAISPFSGGRPMPWNSPTILALLPQILTMGVLARGIHLSLARQERASARESVLARSGRLMLGVTDVDRIREIGRDAAAELVALHPGTVMLVLGRRTGRARVAGVAGAPADLCGRALSDPVAVDAEQLSLLLPDIQYWHIDPMGVDPDIPDRHVAVGAVRHLPADVLDAFRTLSHQVLLAEASCLAVAELDHRAHHDHLTELPTRAKFLRALDHAIADDATGVVALLNVDLDDFKKVNDDHGHAAGDELLVEVARRLIAADPVRGMAARFGGDEFALLLTGLADAREAELVAERLIARLAEPITLSTATVAVGASIGIAVAAPGIKPADLTRRADLAMYAAKTAGKNRIETYRRPAGALLDR